MTISAINRIRPRQVPRVHRYFAAITRDWHCHHPYEPLIPVVWFRKRASKIRICNVKQTLCIRSQLIPRYRQSGTGSGKQQQVSAWRSGWAESPFRWGHNMYGRKSWNYMRQAVMWSMVSLVLNTVRSLVVPPGGRMESAAYVHQNRAYNDSTAKLYIRTWNLCLQRRSASGRMPGGV